MIEGESPYKVVKTNWHTWFCEGPYQSGKQWEKEKDAQDECDTLNSVFNTGFYNGKNNLVSNITVCKLPYQEQFFVHAEKDGADAWLCQNGTWTFEDGDKNASLPGNNYLKDATNKFKSLKSAESDIAHAYACAKEFVPDYPWDDKRQTASQAVYACGSAYEGISKACEDWRRLFAHLAPKEYSSLLEMAMKDTEAYDALLRKLEEKK